MMEIDQRFNILGGVTSQIDDPRSVRHADHSLLQLLRQRVPQVAAGYEDCNDANHLRVDPALRLALGKVHECGAGQSALCRFENNILATGEGLKPSKMHSADPPKPSFGLETNGGLSFCRFWLPFLVAVLHGQITL